MKRFYSLAAAVCMVTLAASAQRPGEPEDFTMTFSIENGTPVMRGSLKAPTTYYGSDELLTSIDCIKVTRSCYDAGESDEPVYTINNPTPGETYTFTDECDLPLEFGFNYSYSARTYVGDSESWSANKYVFAGIKPASPAVSIATADQGQPPVTMTITAPVKDSEGVDLSVPLTRIVVTEYVSYTDRPERHVIENPVAGRTYTWINDDVSAGNTYSYRIYAECEYGKSDETSADVLVGSDVPGKPVGLTVSLDPDAGAVLNWTAPDQSKNGGWFDPEATRYSVQRSVNGSFVTLEENFDGTTYIDDLSDLTSPQKVSWRVTAINETGEGGYAYTDDYIAGPPARLPFAENVSNEKESYYGVEYDFNHLWTTEFSGYSSSWDATSSDYSTDMTGVDATEGGEEGFIRYYGRYASAGTSEWILSPDIDVKDTRHLVLSFHYTAIGKDMGIEAAYMLDGTPVVLKDIRTDNTPEEGSAYTWHKVILPIGNLADTDRLALRFRAYVPEGVSDTDNIGIDRIVLDDYCPVEAINVNSLESTTTISWEPATNGRITADKYLVRVNDAEPTETSDMEHSFASVKGEPYTVSVTPVYDDIESVPATVSFTGGAQAGISGITDASADVEYFTADGLRVSCPEKGMLLIRRTTTSDGKVTFSKVVF